MVSEDKKNVKEVGRSLLNPPPPLPPPTKLKLVPSLSVKDKKNEVETSIFDCDTSKPCISFKCSEKKRKVNYGRRIDLNQINCEHIQVSGSDCEKCCKLINLDKYVISLHCAWHHSSIECYKCKGYVEDKSKLIKGFSFCFQCYQRLKGNHAIDLKTVHFFNAD